LSGLNWYSNYYKLAQKQMFNMIANG